MSKGLRRRDRPNDGKAAEARTFSRGYARTPASGASSIKGDARDRDVLVEVKSTKHGSYRLTLDVLRKLEGEARMASRDPALVVDFSEWGARYVVVPEDVYERLREEARRGKD